MKVANCEGCYFKDLRRRWLRPQRQYVYCEKNKKPAREVKKRECIRT